MTGQPPVANIGGRTLLEQFLDDRKRLWSCLDRALALRDASDTDPAVRERLNASAHEIAAVLQG